MRIASVVRVVVVVGSAVLGACTPPPRVESPRLLVSGSGDEESVCNPGLTDAEWEELAWLVEGYVSGVWGGLEPDIRAHIQVWPGWSVSRESFDVSRSEDGGAAVGLSLDEQLIVLCVRKVGDDFVMAAPVITVEAPSQ